MQSNLWGQKKSERVINSQERPQRATKGQKGPEIARKCQQKQDYKVKPWDIMNV